MREGNVIHKKTIVEYELLPSVLIGVVIIVFTIVIVVLPIRI